MRAGTFLRVASDGIVAASRSDQTVIAFAQQFQAGPVHVLDFVIAIDELNRLGNGIKFSDDGVEGVVDPLDDLTEIALVTVRVGAEAQAAMDGGVGKGLGIGESGS